MLSGFTGGWPSVEIKKKPAKTFHVGVKIVDNTECSKAFEKIGRNETSFVVACGLRFNHNTA